MTTRKEQLAELQKDAREAKKAGKSAISVPIDVLLSIKVDTPKKDEES